MKSFFELFDPLIVAATFILIVIFVYSLLGDMNRNRLIKKAMEKDQLGTIQNLNLGSTGSAVFKKALGDTPALLAFSLLTLNGYLLLGNREIPDFLSKAFFLSMGFYFGNKFSGKGRGDDHKEAKN